jgi:hypothetical protein
MMGIVQLIALMVNLVVLQPMDRMATKEYEVEMASAEQMAIILQIVFQMEQPTFFVHTSPGEGREGMVVRREMAKKVVKAGMAAKAEMAQIVHALREGQEMAAFQRAAEQVAEEEMVVMAGLEEMEAKEEISLFLFPPTIRAGFQGVILEDLLVWEGRVEPLPQVVRVAPLLPLEEQLQALTVLL